MSTFTGTCGHVFHDRRLPAGATRGAIVLLHGYGEHLGLYDPFARRPAETRQAVVDTWPEIAAGLDAGRPDVPTLLVHGEADPIVPVEHAGSVASTLPRATVRTFAGDPHDVLNEHDRDTVHDVVAEFVNTVVSASAVRA